MASEKNTLMSEFSSEENKLERIYLNFGNYSELNMGDILCLKDIHEECFQFPIITDGQSSFISVNQNDFENLVGKPLYIVSSNNNKSKFPSILTKYIKLSGKFTQPEQINESFWWVLQKDKTDFLIYIDSKQNVLNYVAQKIISANIISFKELVYSEKVELTAEYNSNEFEFSGVHFHQGGMNNWDSFIPCSAENNRFSIIINFNDILREPDRYEMYLRFTYEKHLFFVPLNSLFQKYLKYSLEENERIAITFEKNRPFSVRWYFENYNLSITNFHFDSNKYKFKLVERVSVGETTNQIRIKKRKTNQFYYVTLFKENDYYCFSAEELSTIKVDELFRGDLQLPVIYPSGRVDYYYLKEQIKLIGKYINIDACNHSDFLSQSFYIAQNGRVSYVIGTHQRVLNESYSWINPLLNRISVKKNHFIVEVDTRTTEFKASCLHIHFRKGEDWNEKQIVPNSERLSKDGNIIQLFFIDVQKYDWEQFYQDLYLKYEANSGITFFRKIKNESRVTKWKLRYSLNSNQFLFPYDSEIDGRYLIYPYITRSNELSLNYRIQGKFETRKYKWNEKLAVLQFLFTWWRPDLKNLWLTHEKYGETAQDNSYYFFKFMYDHHPEKKLFYVIDDTSSDFKRLSGMEDRVLSFMSRKHLYYLLFASLIVASESKGHGFSWRTSKGLVRQALDLKPFVFLQHGVLGLKQIDDTFSASGLNKAEMFTTSSEFEKHIVIDYLGYKEDAVVVTGLPRWDNLNQGECKKNKSILIMPTWRNWLEEVEDKVFLQSQYFITYNNLINSQEFAAFLKKYGLTANFYLHPKFNQYSHLFKNVNPNLHIIYFGEAPVNELIKQSSILVTDYSSVAWEALYQKIPTIFYQFDQEKYLEEQGAYMDLNKDLFGPVSITEKDLLNDLSLSIENGLDENTISDIQKKYFSFVDQNNAKRVYREILKREKNIEVSTVDLIIQRIKSRLLFWRRKL